MSDAPPFVSGRPLSWLVPGLEKAKLRTIQKRVDKWGRNTYLEHLYGDVGPFLSRQNSLTVGFPDGQTMDLPTQSQTLQVPIVHMGQQTSVRTVALYVRAHVHGVEIWVPIETVRVYF